MFAGDIVRGRSRHRPVAGDVRGARGSGDRARPRRGSRRHRGRGSGDRPFARRNTPRTTTWMKIFRLSSFSPTRRRRPASAASAATGARTACKNPQTASRATTTATSFTTCTEMVRSSRGSSFDESRRRRGRVTWIFRGDELHPKTGSRRRRGWDANIPRQTSNGAAGTRQFGQGRRPPPQVPVFASTRTRRSIFSPP